MKFLKSPATVFILAVLLPLLSQGEDTPQNTESVNLVPGLQNCATPTPWSDNTYEELRLKLEVTLKEKNNSLISLDFKGLQAQVDVAINHMNSQDNVTSSDLKNILKKNLAYLEQLENLINKAKETTRVIKEGHVVPLATLTSLKAESDQCQGVESQFSEIFQTLSQLNKDLNEILMLSPQRLITQQERVKKLLEQLDDSNNKMNLQTAVQAFNFIQTQINVVTSAFDFDSKNLQVAKH